MWVSGNLEGEPGFFVVSPLELDITLKTRLCLEKVITLDQSFPPFHISAVLARFCSFSYPANHQPSEIQNFPRNSFQFFFDPCREWVIVTRFERQRRRLRKLPVAFSSRPTFLSFSSIFVVGFRSIGQPRNQRSILKGQITLIREIVRSEKMPRTIENCLARLKGSFIIQLEK